MIIRHLLAWFGIAFLAVLNGAVRDLVYRPATGELAAHQISTGLLIVLIGAAAWLLQSRWPLGTAREAAAVGVSWMLLTIAFECILGRAVAGKPWDAVLADYNLAAGRVWILVPLWLLIAPAAARRFRAGRAEAVL